MKQQATAQVIDTDTQFSQPVTGKPLTIGSGFSALSFKHHQFDGLMDPLVMLDHYTMSNPTFGAHPHAGMSALSILFEDSAGIFNNRDSLGNDIDLLPGDMYWLKAGSGAVHDERPTEGSRTHGLQIFVNLPRRHKDDAPASLHVPARDMPVVAGDGYRVRVVLGESNGTQGARSPAMPLTALDVYLEAGGGYIHEVSSHEAALIYAVSGDISITLGGQHVHLPEQHAVAIRVDADAEHLQLASTGKAHVVVLQGAPLHEQFVQKGPFVMNTLTEIDQVAAAYEAGQLGSIAE